MTEDEALEYISFQKEHDRYATKRAGKLQIIEVPSVPTGIPKAYFSDRQFVEKAVKINGLSLTLAADKFRQDRELILSAAENSGDSLYFYLNLPSALKNDFEFMQKLLSLNGGFLKQMKFELFNPFTAEEKQLILTAVEQNYEAADHIKNSGNFALNNDKEFVLALVKTDGRVLKFVGNDFKVDEEIVIAAAKNTYRAFEYASHRLRTDENFVLKLLKINPSCLAYAPRKLREDRALVENLMEIHPYVYRYAKGEMKKDIGLALRAVRLDPTLYEFIEHDVWDSKEFFKGMKKLLKDKTLEKEKYEYLKSFLKYNSRYKGLFNE